MITVAILINGNPLMARSAVRIGKKHPSAEEVVYELDTGERLSHNPDDGAVKLAIRMLETIKEQGND